MRDVAHLFIRSLPTLSDSVIPYDTLVRAGISCTSALVNDIPDTIPTPSPVAKCSRGVKIIADKDLADVEDPVRQAYTGARYGAADLRRWR